MSFKGVLIGSFNKHNALIYKNLFIEVTYCLYFAVISAIRRKRSKKKRNFDEMM